MFLQTIIIMGAMLGLLTLVSTLGGSMNVRERFEDEMAADRGESGQLSGEILRAADRKMQEVAEEIEGGPGAGGDDGSHGGSGPGDHGGSGPGDHGGDGGAPDPPSHGMGGGSHGMDGGSHGTGGGAQGDGLGAVEPYEEMVASWDGGIPESGGRRR